MAKNKKQKDKGDPEQAPDQDAQQAPLPARRPPIASRTATKPPGTVSRVPGPGSGVGSTKLCVALLRDKLKLSAQVSVEEVARAALAEIRRLEDERAEAFGERLDTRSQSPVAQL